MQKGRKKVLDEEFLKVLSYRFRPYEIVLDYSVNNTGRHR